MCAIGTLCVRQNIRAGRPSRWGNEFDDFNYRDAQRLADLARPMARYGPGSAPVENGCATTTQQSRKLLHTARLVDEKLNIHVGIIVGYIDRPCQRLICGS